MTIRTHVITLSLTYHQSFTISDRSRWVLSNMWIFHPFWPDYTRSSKFIGWNQGIYDIVYFRSSRLKTLFRSYPMSSGLYYILHIGANMFSTLRNWPTDVAFPVRRTPPKLFRYVVLSPAITKFSLYIGHWWLNKLLAHSRGIIFYIEMIILRSIWEGCPGL